MRRGSLAVALGLALSPSSALAHEGAPLTLSRLDFDAAGPAVFYERAESYRNLRRIDDALVMLELVEALHPEASRVWLERGRLERDRGRHAAAIDALTRYLDSEVSAANAHGAYLLRARSNAELGRTARALDDYRAALAASPGVDAYFEAGRLLRALDRDRDAEALLARGVASTGAAVLVEALARAQATRDLEAAEATLAPLLASAPVKTRWLLVRAELRAAGGHAESAAADRRAALAEAQRLVARRPTPLAWTARAAALHALGRDAEARRDLERALKRSPELTPATELLAAIEGGAR